jgi:hypothetical protein
MLRIGALILAATTLIGMGKADASRATVVQVWPETTLCMSYESAVIARQIRKGTLPGRPVPKNCGVAEFRLNVPVLIDGDVMYVSIPLKDGTDIKYWVGSDDVGGVASER